MPTLPLPTTYPPTIDYLIQLYSYVIPSGLEQYQTRHYQNALDKIDILTSGRARTQYVNLTDECKLYLLKAIATLFMYYFDLNSNFARGSFSASQGANSVTQSFEYPQTINPEVYNLLELSGLYTQNNNMYIGDSQQQDYGDNVWLDQTNYQPLPKGEAYKTFLYGDHLKSSDNSVAIVRSQEQDGVNYDLKAKSASKVLLDGTTIQEWTDPTDKKQKLTAYGLRSVKNKANIISGDAIVTSLNDDTQRITDNKNAIIPNTQLTTDIKSVINIDTTDKILGYKTSPTFSDPSQLVNKEYVDSKTPSGGKILKFYKTIPPIDASFRDGHTLVINIQEPLKNGDVIFFTESNGAFQSPLMTILIQDKPPSTNGIQIYITYSDIVGWSSFDVAPTTSSVSIFYDTNFLIMLSDFSSATPFKTSPLTIFRWQ